jgi:exopolysaccharide biosynthesis polyprenyl glycosylphosphotransferase
VLDTSTDSTAVFIARPSLPWASRRAKRVLDVMLSVLALCATAPLWLVIAIAIKLDSPGPVVFVQERVGQYGQRFRFLKFRSMRVDAEARLAELAAHNEVTGPVFKMRNDPRVTRVGRILRRTSLDELPQLINVLRGEMSLVGPRPALPTEVVQYRPEDHIRLAVPPGLTCLWVLAGRSNCDFNRWMEYDREYIRRFSIRLDILILLRTIGIVISGRGAY